MLPLPEPIPVSTRSAGPGHLRQHRSWCPPEARSIAGAKPTVSSGTSSAKQAGLFKYLQLLVTSNFSTAPRAFLMLGPPQPRKRASQKRLSCVRPSPMPIGRWSNTMGPQCGRGADRASGAGYAGLQRPGNDRRWPPLGVKAVESDQRATQKAPVAHRGGA